MSGIVATLVYSKVIGSAHRKAVLAYVADRANDDGSGVWCSKQTIADETEVARSTVIKTINEFVAEGILSQTGTRPCANGSTVEYRINIGAVQSLPDVQKRHTRPVRQPDPSDIRTSLDVDPSDSRTPPVRQPDPKPSDSRTLTVLEPSMNQESISAPAKKSKRVRTSIPQDAAISGKQIAIAADVGITSEEAEAQFARFKGRALAKGETYADWDQAWRNWLTSPYFKPITRINHVSGTSKGTDRLRAFLGGAD